VRISLTSLKVSRNTEQLGRQGYFQSFTNAVILKGKGNKLPQVMTMGRGFSSSPVNAKRYKKGESGRLGYLREKPMWRSIQLTVGTENSIG